MVELRGYIDEKGNRPFAGWFAELDNNAAARVATAMTRMEQGNFSNVKGVGGGVLED
jgi:putative component of toxin-antitoxin plasmid stabilization module